MIIEAKSTRLPAEAKDGRKRYETKGAEKLSRVPLYFALFVTAIAAYLKSAFPGQAHTFEDGNDATGQGPSGSSSSPRNHADDVPGIDDLLDYVQTGSTEDDDEPANSIGRNHGWNTNYLYPDTPALRFVDMAAPSAMLKAFFPVAFSYAPSNDNGATYTTPAITGAPAIPGLTIVPAVTRVDDDDDTHNPDDDDDDDGGDDDTDPHAGNRSPVVRGPVRLNDVFAGQVVLIGLAQLLQGASDPDGDALTVMNVTVDASATHTGNSWSVATVSGTLGRVSFTYAISDGHTSVAQTAYFDIVRNVVVLTPCDDVYSGTPYDDDIDGLAGDDIIDSQAGNDLVVGGDGDDFINGGDGDDDLFGNAGNDVIAGGNGNDTISGGSGNDRLFGDNGDDIITGEAGHDYLAGGQGNDILDGGDGDDILEAGDGDDVLAGKAGNDMLDGGQGNDGLDGGHGNDTLRGGIGKDVLDGGDGNDDIDGGEGDDIILADAGDDTIDGGDGIDTITFAGSSDDVTIDFIFGTVQSESTGRDSLSGVETAIGGDGDDLFLVSAAVEVTLTGGRGRDLFVFEAIGDTATVSADVVHDILDFVVGDRVRVKDYGISEQAEGAQAEFFRALYEEDGNDDWLASDLPILLRYERYDDVDHTIIQADMNRDSIYEVTIDIHGILLPETQTFHVA